MRYARAQEIARGLHEFADFIAENGHKMPVNDLNMKFDDFVFDDYKYEDRRHLRTAREKMRLLALILAPVEKVYNGEWFDLRKKFGPVTLEFTVNRAIVCERKVVSVEEVPEKLIPAYTREIVEWECNDPILRVNGDN